MPITAGASAGGGWLKGLWYSSGGSTVKLNASVHCGMLSVFLSATARIGVHAPPTALASAISGAQLPGRNTAKAQPTNAPLYEARPLLTMSSSTDASRAIVVADFAPPQQAQHTLVRTISGRRCAEVLWWGDARPG